MSRLSPIRTNLLILATSTSLMGAWYYYLWHGVTTDLPGRNALGTIWWSLAAVSLLLAALLLQFVKDVRRKALRRSVGLLTALPFPFLAWLSFILGSPVLLAITLPMFACAAYAVWTEERETGPNDRDLFLVCASVILVAFPLFAVLPGMAAAVPVPLLALPAFAGVGLTALVVLLRNPGGFSARVARIAAGGAFLGLIGALTLHGRFLEALMLLPWALGTLAHPAFARYSAGIHPDEAKLPEESVAVRRFIRVDERAGWIGVSFIEVLFFFDHGLGTPAGLLMFSFVIFNVVHVRQFRFYDPKKVTFSWYHAMMHRNLGGISLMTHASGGLASPAALYLPFMVWAGIVTPKSKFIERQISIVFAFLLFEAAYMAATGTLTRHALTDRLLPLLVVSAIVYVFLRDMALERNVVDEKLRHANTALNASKKRDIALFTSLADAILVCGVDGVVTQMNQAATELLGREARVIGERPEAVLLMWREDGTKFSLRSLIDGARDGRSSRIPDDLYIESEGGGKRYLAGYVAPFMLDDGALAGVVVTVRDVTIVHEADKVKANFLSIAAHQLRTPLTNIRWHLELALDNVAAALGAEGRGFIDDAYAASRRLIRLMGGILAAARLESGRVPFNPEPVNLGRMIDGIVDTLKERAEKKNVRIVNAMPDLPLIALDPVLAREVFGNLIENAVRYNKEGGKVTVRAEARSSDVVVTVEDNGIGIPAEQQKKVFTKFFRAENAIHYSGEGTGLGLFLARYIANAWGGTITFDSEVGKGTRFHVLVPKKGMGEKAGSISLHA